MLISLPSLLNVGALIILDLFIYSVLGVFLFSNVKIGNSITEYTNFWVFHSFNWGKLVGNNVRCRKN